MDFSSLFGSSVNAKRMARVTSRKSTAVIKSMDAFTLRKAQRSSAPALKKIFSGFTSTAALQAKLERAGMRMSAEMFITMCVAIIVACVLAFVVMKKPPAFGLILGIFFGFIIPRFVVNFRANKRLKKFLILFPDAIDFIVRGLRSGLPVSESMNMVGQEMEQPVAGIFREIGESVKLGVTLEKALQDTAKKLKSTEFNFFATSIVLQRETGGNLSEILNNLADVLRKRYMMRMKIKAMSSEAKASAMIVGSLPFIVITALTFVAPDYLTPLWTESSGNIAAGCAALSLTIGITVMIKMSQFEI
jgi:tight adherence protein B